MIFRESDVSDTAAERYEHKQEAVQRPDVGVEDQFSIKRPNRVIDERGNELMRVLEVQA